MFVVAVPHLGGRPKMVLPPHGEGHEAQRAQRTQEGVDAVSGITVSVPIYVPS